MTQQELNKIVHQHYLWFCKKPEGIYANLVGVNLQNLDLSNFNLTSINLFEANLSGANLYGVDLFRANLCCANLHGANLTKSNLYEANLINANLIDADLSQASFNRANLSHANLQRANLFEASLIKTNLTCTYLFCTQNFPQKEIKKRSICPTGEFLAFKKLNDNSICILKIPADAGRVGGLTSRICRAEYAVVVKGNGWSIYDSDFAYAKGQTIRPNKWDPNPLIECSYGINFFLTEEEALDY